MGKIKFNLILATRLVNKRPNELIHKYKDLVEYSISNILVVAIIYDLERLEWANCIVVLLKNKDAKK